MNMKNSIFTLLILTCFLFGSAIAISDDNLPSSPSVAVGSATVTTDGDTMNIISHEDKYWGDYDSFNIGAGHTLNTTGPSSSAVMLHNVTGPSGSNLAGMWNSNCNQFLINPNGILISPTATLNLGSLVASTLKMSKEDFLAGNYVFNSNDIENLTSITNAGAINTLNKAGVTLIGGAVENLGVINANFGSVNLISGSEVTLNIAGDGSIQAAVSKEVLGNVYDQDGEEVNFGVENLGTITADGGKIYIQVEAVQNVFDKLINQEGIIRAGSMVEENGRIVLKSNSEGIIQNTGTMTASAIEDGAGGGSIEMRGSKVGQFGEVHADAMGSGDGGSIMLYANDAVALTSGSITTANAAVDGSGGEIIVYSPGTANFWSGARIEAKGGSNSGDGGFVEVSGRNSMIFQGRVTTLAANGNPGMLLIDPKNIEIATDGADVVADNDLFGDNPAASAALSVANVITAIQDGGLTLQANDTITITNAVDSSGSAGSLTLQAGRSILVNASIKVAGAFTATANDSGATDAQRTDATAVFTMADGTTIDTSTGGDNITITMSTGPTTSDQSGDITLENLDAGAGHVLVVNGGDDPNELTGNILRASNDALITAASVALDATPTNITTGAVGTSSAPIRVTTTNLEAIAQSGGVYIESPTQDLTLGGATLGGLTGISTTNNGAITLDAATGNIDTADQTVSSGSGAILFISDTIDLGTTPDTINTTGALTLQTTTPGTTIGIGDGATGTYDLDAAEIVAINATGTPGITIGQVNGTGAVDIDDCTFDQGNITIHGGAMAMEHIDIGAHTLALNSTGAITDALLDTTNNVTATTLNIEAVDGVGSADVLETIVSNLSIINNDDVAGTSNIQVTNTGDLTLNGTANYDGGNITIIANSELMVSGDQTTTGSGNITLTASDDDATSGDNITIGDDILIYTDLGDILLTAGDNISYSGTGGLIQTGGGGTITLTAGNEGVTSTDDVIGSIAQAGTAQIISGGGLITLTAGPDGVKGDADDNSGSVSGGYIAITYINAGSGNVTVRANSFQTLSNVYGKITDVDDSTGSDIIGGTVTLTTAGGIGATGESASIEVDATTITATNATEGGIFLNAVGTGGVGITAHAQTAGNIEIYGTENVTLTDVDTDLDTDDAGGTITVQITGADIIATAVDGGIEDATNPQTVVSLTTLTSGNITLTHVTGTNRLAGAGNISISSAGSILTGNNDNNDDVQADDTLTMSAAQNIGTSGAANFVEVDATTLNLTSSNGGMYIEDLGAGGVGVTANSQGTGNIVMTSTEVVTLTDVDTNQGALTVTVTNAGVGANTLIATDVDANGIVTLTTVTNGNILATAIDTTDDNITLEAAQAISVGAISADTATASLTASGGTITDAEAGEETNADVTAGTIVLSATAGIGASGNPLDTVTTGSSIEASTTAAAAHIDIDNTTTANSTLTVSTIGANANITFDQDGGGNLEVISATTTNGDIDISVDKGDLTATLITALDDGNILLDTTTSGDIKLGAVTATGDEVTLNSVAAITDNNAGLINITAQVLDIDRATTIGAAENVVDIDIDTLEMALVSGASYLLEVNTVDLSVIDIQGALSVQTTAGNITATSVDTTDDDVTLTSAGDIIVVDLDVDGATVYLDADGAITAAGDVVGVVAGTLTITDATNVGTGTGAVAALNTNIDTLNMSNVDGASYIIEDDTITLGDVNVNGLVNVIATLGDVTATSVITSDDNVTLQSVAAAISVGLINAGAGTATLTAATTINDAAVDSEIDITAAVVDLNAADGIGETNALELAATTIDADTTGVAGGESINLSNVNAAATTVNSLTTVGVVDANITFAQTGGGSLTVTTATTVDGDITISVDDGDLTATTVTAGADGNIILTTTNSGDVYVDAVTAADDQITITSAARIEESGTDGPPETADIVATTIDLNAATGIGTLAQLEIQGTALTMDSASGDINIDNLTPGGTVTITTMTTGPGNITYDQTGDVNLNLTRVKTDNGDVTITNSGGTTADILIGSAVGAPGVEADIVDDTISITSSGAITASADDADAEIVGATITLDATDGGIGQGGNSLDINATVALNATTTTDSGNITIDDITLDLPIGAITAGTGTVSLTSAGTINDATTDTTADITADTVDLNAVTGIGAAEELELASVVTLTADTTNGNIDIDHVADVGVTITTMTTGIGNINYDQTGTQILGVTLAQVTDGDISISNNGAINLVDINGDTTDGIVTLTATGSALTTTDSADAVSAYTLTIVTATTVGADTVSDNAVDAGWFDIDVTDLNITTAGNTYIDENDDINLLDVTTTGEFGVDAAGELKVTQVDSTGQAVFLTTTADIVDGGEAVPDVTASSLRMTAGTGICDSGDTYTGLETVISTLAATTVTGDINVANTGALTIDTLDAVIGVTITTGGATHHIVVTASSPLTVSSVVSNTGGGDITLAAEDALVTDDLTINANITAAGGSGSISLYAGHDVLHNTAGTIQTANTGTINIYAGVDYNSGTPKAGHATGSVTQADNLIIQSTGTGAITIKATENVAVCAVGTGGTVNITADDDTYGLADGAGAITDVLGNETANITCTTATLRTATGIGTSVADIDTNITALDALNTTSGDIYITQLATGGEVSVNQATQQSPAGADNDGVINIQTENGSLTIVADQYGVTAVDAGTITLIAGDSLGSYNDDLEVDCAVTSNTGKITLTSSGNDVTFGVAGDVTTTSGEIEVNALSGVAPAGEGKITMSDGTVLNAGDDIIDLNAYGDIALGSLVTTNSTAAAVDVNTSDGAVTDANGTSVNITAGGEATIAAKTGVDVDTTVATIDVENETSGAININETDGLLINRIIQTTAGSITVTTAGATTVVAALGGVTTAGDGDSISITVAGDSSLTVNDAVTAANGTIDLKADNDVIFGADGDVDSATVGAGDTITITADNDSDADGTGGALTMVNGTLVDAGSGTITVSADEDITLGGLLTTNNTGSAVSITSTSGAIIDGGITHTDIDANEDNAVVTIDAVTGVGTDDALDVSVYEINIDNNTDSDKDAVGDIRIVEIDGSGTDDLIVSKAVVLNPTGPEDGDINIATTTGELTISGVVTTAMDGTITLFADGAAEGDLTVNAAVTSVNGNITLKADNDIEFNASGDVTSTTGNVTVTADFDNPVAAGSGLLTMVDGTVIDAGSGTIDLTADGNIMLGRLVTTNSSNTAVRLVTREGGIIDNGDTAGADIVAADGRLVIEAVTGVGSSTAGAGADADIETTVASIDVHNTTSGNIQIDETDAITVIKIDNDMPSDTDATTGTISLVADGAITVEAGESGVTAIDGNVTLQADNDASIIVNTVVETTLLGNIVISADDDITFALAGDVTASGAGNITITADDDGSAGDAGQGGAITMADNNETIAGVADATIINAGTGLISMSADEDITIARLITAHVDASHTETEVLIVSASGAIVDAGDSGAAALNQPDIEVDQDYGTVSISALTGIGTDADAIETEVRELAATTTSGDINIDNTGTLAIVDASGYTPTGVNGITITGGSSSDSITVTTEGPLTISAVVTDTGGGNVLLAATGTAAANDMTIAAAISAAGANGNVTLYAGHDILQTTGDITAAGSGSVNVYAGVDYNSGTPQAGHATADITQSDGRTISSTSGNITMTATENIALSIVSTTGDVSITADDNTYSLGDSIGEITDALSTEAANILAAAATLSAATGIGATDDIETTVTSLTASVTSTGVINITETDTITLTSVTTTDGPINLVSGGAMTVTEVTAGGDTGSNDDVTLTTTSGDIIMSGNITALNDEVTLVSAANITDTTDGATDISARNLTITANAGAVGSDASNGELDTDVDTLTLAARGNTYVLEENDITLTSVVTTGGLVDIETVSGTMTVTTVTAGGHNHGVSLVANGGNIYDTGGALITASAQSSFRTSGIIGTTDNPVNVDIDGDLWVWAGAEKNGVSVMLEGNVNSSAETERVRIYKPSPPGLVMLNNRLMGGGNYGSGSIRGSILSRGYGYIVMVKGDSLDMFYNQAMQPWAHKVLLPETSLISGNFLDGPSVTIDGSSVGVDVMPRDLIISPDKFQQPVNYYIIRKEKEEDK